MKQPSPFNVAHDCCGLDSLGLEDLHLRQVAPCANHLAD